MRNSRYSRLPMTKRHYWLSAFLIGILLILFAAGCAFTPANLPPITEQQNRSILAGKFVWYDLLTENPDKAQAFYRGLFGWTFEEQTDYVLIKQNGQSIGGIVSQENRDPDTAESLWLPNISVNDVDAVVKDFKQAGGKILEKPIDVTGRGRMAVVQDPQGAPLVVLRSATGDPEDHDPVVNRWVWADLFTKDTASAVIFYQKVIGYAPKKVTTKEGERFTVLFENRTPRAGVVEMPFKGVTPNWVPYVYIKDINAAVASAEKLGGKLLIRVKDAAIIEDPTGAAIGIQSLEKENTGGAS